MSTRLGVVALLAASACANHRIDALELRVAALEARSGGVARTGLTDAQQADADEMYRLANEAAANGDVPAAKAALARLREAYPTSRSMTAALRLEAELAVIGRPAPETTVSAWFTPTTGDLGAPGTTVVVFFETWCPHCQREMPKMAALARTLPDVHFVAFTKVTRSSTDADVTAMIDAGQWPFPVGRDPGALSTAFAIEGIPAAAVLHDGKIVWRGHPARLTPELVAAFGR